ncbi:tetratricopeptide repeat protein [Actinoplanes sp. NPDC023714]|uniref:tetratricopeptide repeat protein n=1 Tax=Actinoplanes sp. NPDC023714 TaxID=3154322 RepID=UPI0033CE125F
MTGVVMVYVACSAGDTGRATRLCEALESRGLRTFPPGRTTVTEMDAAIERCGAAVVLLSDDGDIRGYAALVERADLGSLTLVPVVFDGAPIPPSLSGRERLDFTTAGTREDHERRYDALAAALLGAPVARRGLAAAPGFERTSERPLDIRLAIGPGETTVVPPSGEPVAAAHSGLTDALLPLADKVERHRRLRPSRVEQDVHDIGRELGRCFLPGPVAAALAGLLAGAATRNQAARIRLETAIAGLPWETIILPGEEVPLALRPQVRLYRGSDLGPTAQPDIPGPLRILAVVAGPDDGDQALLDYEHELSTILRRVDGARRGGAHVRVLNWGSVAAIREALHEERFHILHISCHAAPGRLLMETADGGADEVDAARLAREVVLPDRGVPLVVLAGCDTAGAASALPGLASTLLEHGVPTVVAMTAAVGDVYATELLSTVYGRLSRAGEPADPLGALADVRRELEVARAARPGHVRVRHPPEWPTATMFSRVRETVLYDPRTRGSVPRRVPAARVADGIAHLDDGEFVGRRADLRRLLAVLSGRAAAHGVLIHGIGGVGKSSLATQALRMAATGGDTVVAGLHGRCTTDEIMAAVADRLLVAEFPDAAGAKRLHRRLTDAEIGWHLRLEVLRDEVLEQGMEVLILVDDPIGDIHLALDADVRDFLSAWLRVGRGARLLVTARHADALTHPKLLTHHLGPLSRAETEKLIWRLPAVYALDDERRARAYRDLGGHPRTLEYLNAVLGSGALPTGSRPFDRVAERMENGLRRRGVADAREWMRTASGDVDVATAEAIAEASAEVLLDGVLERLAATFPEARALLVAASVHRVPVPATALRWVVTEPAAAVPERVDRLRQHYDRLARARAEDPDVTLDDLPATAAERAQRNRDLAAQTLPADVPWLDAACAELTRLGLLTPVAGEDGEPRWVVHRWTASTLAAAAPAEVLRAHRRAAAYRRWWARLKSRDPGYDHSDLEEAHHHCIAVGDHDQAVGIAAELCLALDARSALRQEQRICLDTAELLGPGQPAAWLFHHQLGVIALRLGDYDDAESHLERCRRLAEDQGDTVAEAAALRELGALAQLRGGPDVARDRYLRAAQRCQEPAVQGTPAALTVLASSYQQLGALTLARGDHEAWRWSIGALRIARELAGTNELAAADRDLARLARAVGDQQLADEHELAAGESTAVGLDSVRLLATSALQSGAVQLMRGAPGMASRHLVHAFRAARTLDDLPLLAQCAQHYGDVLFEVGDHGNALRMYRDLATLADQLEDPVRCAIAEQQIGRVIAELGDEALAERHFAEADAIAARLRSRSLRAATSLFRGSAVLTRAFAVDAAAESLAGRADRLDTARELFERAMADAEDTDDAVWVASAIQRGVVDARRGDPPGAAHWFGRALHRAAATGNHRSMVACLTALGLLARQDGRDDDAVRTLLEAVDVATSCGDERAAAGGLLHLGRIAGDRGDLAEAELWYGRAVSLVDPQQDADLVAEARRQRGRCRLEHERYEEALADLGAAAGLYRDLEAPAALAWCLLHLCRGLLKTCDDEGAEAAGAEAGELAARMPDSPLRVVALLAAGEQRHDQGDPEAAAVTFEAALSCANRIETPPAGLTADALRMLARAYRAAGDPAAALARQREAIAVAEAQHDRIAIMHDSRDLGRLCRLLGRDEQARSYMEQSAGIAAGLHDGAALRAATGAGPVDAADGTWRDIRWLRRTRHIVGERPFADGTPRYLGPSVDQVLREMSPRWSAITGVPLVCRPFRLSARP